MSNQQHLINTKDFLLKAFDPNELSIEEFVLKDYLRNLIKDAAMRWSLDAVVIRRLDQTDLMTFKVLSVFGIKEDDIIQYEVTLKNSMAKELARRVDLPLKKKYYPLDNISNPGSGYDQWELANKYALDSLISFPLVVNNRIDGFIVYFRKKGSAFNSAEIRFLGIDLNSIIERIFTFADSLRRLGTQYHELSNLREDEKKYDALDQNKEAAYRFNHAARSYLRHDILYKSALNFTKAAKAMLESQDFQNHPDDINFVAENYLESAVVWAQLNDEKRYNESYYSFCNALNLYESPEKSNFYFDKLIHKASSYGLEALARRAYIDKNDFKNFEYYFTKVSSGACSFLGNKFSRIAGKWEDFQANSWCIVHLIDRLVLSPFAFLFLSIPTAFLWFPRYFWRKTSNCGENWFRWSIFVLTTILLFALCYYPTSISTPSDNGTQYFTSFFDVMDFHASVNIVDAFRDKLISAVSFSITVFSTLGFGDIVPCNCMARVIVSFEVLAGYASLGVFVTLVTRKMIRK